MELEESVGLEVQRLGVVGRQQDKRLIDAVGVAGEGERQVWKVVCVDLRLVGAWQAFTLSAISRALEPKMGSTQTHLYS